MFNDFFEAHSGCFSWIVNSLHYLEYSLHILESSIGYVITVYIDYNVYIAIFIIYVTMYILSISGYFRDSINTLYSSFPWNDQISILLS